MFYVFINIFNLIENLDLVKTVFSSTWLFFLMAIIATFLHRERKKSLQKYLMIGMIMLG